MCICCVCVCEILYTFDLRFGVSSQALTTSPTLLLNNSEVSQNLFEIGNNGLHTLLCTLYTTDQRQCSRERYNVVAKIEWGFEKRI